MQLYWIRFFPAFIFIISLYHLPCVCIIIIYISMSPLSAFFSLFTFLSSLFFENSRMAEPCTAMVYILLNVKSLAAVGFSASWKYILTYIVTIFTSRNCNSQVCALQAIFIFLFLVFSRLSSPPFCPVAV